MLQEFARKPPHVLPRRIEHLDGRQDRRNIPLQNRPRKPFERTPAHESEHAERILLRHLVALEGDELIEGRERVAHTAFRTARNRE